MRNIGLYHVVNDLCKSLKQIHTIDDFTAIVNSPTDKVEIIGSTNFADFPYKDLPVIENHQFSPEVIGNIISRDELFMLQSLKFKFMFIISPHGPWIAIDLVNEEFAGYMNGFFRKFEHFVYLDQGFFVHKLSKSIVQLTQYEDINKYMILIGLYRDLFDHPWYSGNKIYYNFSS